ncbi:MAG: ferrous iron transporter B [Planctomycetota bacterium]|nr:ferrous iron transporter B [Planctomycetota bacterium]MDA1113184.1 ferrous iron transporter B [Planctomycetota bacterium]
MTQELRLALVGSPNAGKTTLFNALTGLSAKTGNYPGVTVDRRLGSLEVGKVKITLSDLPGSYSLHAISEDEAVTSKVLKGELDGGKAPDGIVFVADATTLDRSLPMLADVLNIGRPTLLVLTMIDELKARGGDLDLFKLQGELGIPIVGVVGNKGLGVNDLRLKLAEVTAWNRAKNIPEGDTHSRFLWGDEILQKVTRHPLSESRLTRKIDRVLLHPVLGLVVFGAFLAVFFQAIFSWAAPAMDLFSGWMDITADWVLATFPPGLFTNLLADGIIRGVGAVIVFVPQIALLFAIIFMFEASGYMARAAFVVDRVMGWAGLEGRCFISLLSSYACAVPGIMATRSIPSPRDRLATILVAPFATCSARLPVYALLISAFIPDTTVWGPFTYQGMTLMGLYLLGGISAVLFAGIFKRGMLKGASLPFYLELPPYRFPSLRSVSIQVFRRVKVFLKDAGSVILIGSIVLWFLLNFPRHESPADFTAAQAHRAQIEQSYAADLGHAMEPVFDPLGFDWRINVGLIGSFAARELMVSTLAEVYAYEEIDGEHPGLGVILTTPDPKTGEPPMTFASGIALLLFFVYALLCLSTVAVAKRETGGWKWPIFMMSYMGAVAWVAAFIGYTLAS